MKLEQILLNCRRAEARHAACQRPEKRRAAAIEVIHWTQAWLRARRVFMPMSITPDGYIDAQQPQWVANVR